MSNLLDKASIILTPTAYNNGEALCVKPSDGSGDFDFSRNSAATRVNAQGLVENVQILSSNLVQNGDFSEEGVQEVSNGSFSQEGVELITNGNFENGSTGWGFIGAGWTFVGGKATHTGVQSILGQSNILTIGKSYKITFDLSGADNSNYARLLSSQYPNGGNYTSDGTITVYTSTNIDDFLVYAVGDISIDNVSVREVGQDWTLGTGWSIGEDKAIANTTGNFVNLYQNSVFVVGKTYKTTFTISDYTQGSVRLTENGYDISGFQNAVGTYTTYFTASQTALYMQGYESFIGSITNISVKEVGQNWIVGSDWSIAENKAVSSGSGNNLQQTINILSNKTYKLTFDVISTSGTLAFDLGGATAKTLTDSGSKEYYFQSVNTNNLRFYGGNYYGSVTNISVIEITDDTNLPRINYEGFSYQDDLGSEEIVNGTFDSDTAWVKGSNWTISNNKATSDGLIDTYLSQAITGLDLSKTYKVEVTCTDYTSGNLLPKLGSSGFETYITSEGSFTYYGSFGTDATIRFYSSSFIGSIDNVSVKEYLGQEVVPDSGCGSWLFEPQSTNLVSYSEDFSQYSTGNSPIIEGGFLAPDGTNNAYKITNSGSSTVYIAGANFTSAATRSVYARSVSGTGTATLMSYFGNTNNVFTLTEDWQRFEVNGTTAAAGEDNFYAADFRGSGTLTEYIIWGAQVEEQSYATSYIPTSGSTVTRNQDLCNNGATGTGLINSTEGVLYAEIAALANDGTNRRIALSDGTQSNVIFIGYTPPSNYIQLYIAASGVSAVYINYLLNNALDFNKIAIRYKDDNFSAWVNGVQVGTDTSGNVPTTLSELTFDRGDGVFPFYGKTKALAVFPYLSDAELTELTTI